MGSLLNSHVVFNTYTKVLLGNSPIFCNKNGVISTVYVSPDCTPYSVTLVLLMQVLETSGLNLHRV